MKEIQVDHSNFPQVKNLSLEWLRKFKYQKEGFDQVKLGIYSDNKGREVLLLGIAKLFNKEELYAIYTSLSIKDQEQYTESMEKEILIRPLYGPEGFLELSGSFPRYCWVADAEPQVLENLFKKES